MQALHFGIGNVGAGRIVRIGEVDDLRAGAHLCEDRVHARRPVRLLGDDRNPARGANADRIGQKTVLAVEALLAWMQKDMRQQRQQFIGAVAADDPGRIESMAAPDRLAQRGRRAVGIEFEPVRQRAHRLDRLSRRPKRRLVRRKLVNLVHARDMALPRHIGVDRHDFGARLRLADGVGRHDRAISLNLRPCAMSRHQIGPHARQPPRRARRPRRPTARPR